MDFNQLTTAELIILAASNLDRVDHATAPDDKRKAAAKVVQYVEELIDCMLLPDEQGLTSADLAKLAISRLERHIVVYGDQWGGSREARMDTLREANELTRRALRLHRHFQRS